MSNHETATNETSPVIVKPTDEEQLGKLERKLQEYKDRLAKVNDGYTHPDQMMLLSMASGNDHVISTFLKIRVLEEVLAAGSVDCWEFSERLIEGDEFTTAKQTDMDMFAENLANACAT